MNRIALIADLISSKEIPNRNEIQKNLKSILHSLSSGNPSLLSPYTITLGDEFQALYSSSNNLMMDLFQIITALYPIKIRFSLGIGLISTEINPQAALGMDGPAFHYAREGIDVMKKRDHTCLRITAESEEKTMMLNAGADLALAAMDGWKENTFLIFENLLQNKSVNSIYPVLNITQRGVYKIMKANHLQEYLILFRSMEGELEHLLEGSK